MNVVRALPRPAAWIQYDGTNATDIVDYLEADGRYSSAVATDVSPSSMTLSVYDLNSVEIFADVTIPAGSWFSVEAGQLLSDDDLRATYALFYVGS